MLYPSSDVDLIIFGSACALHFGLISLGAVAGPLTKMVARRIDGT